MRRLRQRRLVQVDVADELAVEIDAGLPRAAASTGAIQATLRPLNVIVAAAPLFDVPRIEPPYASAEAVVATTTPVYAMSGFVSV
jgi:hypothetical protein